MAKAKAKGAKLKVFRTVVGFHDAYVAAPTKKAALAAWGSTKDLFGRGIAEQVTDEALMAEPLAAPGKVIKRLRGTEAEQLAALPKDKPKRKAPAAPARKPAAAKALPRPSRTNLDAAEEAIAAAERKHEKALESLAEREKRLADEKRAVRQRQDEEMTRLERDRDTAADAYERALDAWRD